MTTAPKSGKRARTVVLWLVLVGFIVLVLVGWWRSSSPSSTDEVQDRLNAVLPRNDAGLILGEETVTLEDGRAVTCIVAYNQTRAGAPAHNARIVGIDCLEPTSR